MKNYDVAVIRRGWHRPEVVRKRIKVLKAAEKKFELKLNLHQL